MLRPHLPALLLLTAACSTSPLSAVPKGRAEAPTAPPIPPREGAPGSTRGTIACGTARCRAGEEQCSFAKGWKCLPKDDPWTHTHTSLECDDGTDCPQGKTCCLSFATSEEHYVCTVRSGPDADCKAEVCEEGGARCPEGRRCYDGACSRRLPGATCDGKQHCPEEKPYCIWANGAGACSTSTEAQAAAVSRADKPVGIFTCTQPSDCGKGAYCCTSMEGRSQTFCHTNCDLTNTMPLCQTNDDCPFIKVPGPDDKEVSVRMKCISEPATPEVPKWTKYCQYQGP